LSKSRTAIAVAICAAIADRNCRMFGRSKRTHGKLRASNTELRLWQLIKKHCATRSRRFQKFGFMVILWLFGLLFLLFLTFSWLLVPRLVASVIKIQLCEEGVLAQEVKKPERP